MWAIRGMLYSTKPTNFSWTHFAVYFFNIIFFIIDKMASRAGWNDFAGRIWPAGRSLETAGLKLGFILIPILALRLNTHLTSMECTKIAIPCIFVHCHQPSADDRLTVVITQPLSRPLVCAVFSRAYWESVTTAMLWLYMVDESTLYKMGLWLYVYS